MNLMQVIMQQLGNNPMMRNAIQMAQNNDIKGLREMANNIGREKGVNVQNMYNQYSQKLNKR